MPPTRTIPPAKAIKTERTHEENQERSVQLRSSFIASTDSHVEHTLLLPGEVTVVSRLESSQRDEHLKFINAELAGR